MIFRSTSLLLLALVTTISAFDDLASLLDKPLEDGKIWAVLAAGSSMWHNYRHQMVIYIEACYAGSMFENILPTYIEVYATVSAGSGGTSQACYYDTFRKTYLGDFYSVSWMEDSDKKTLTNETLHQQFNVVKKETRSSNVQEFGDMSVSQLPVSEFQGRKESEPLVVPNVPMDLVRSDDVPMEILKRRLQMVHTPEEHIEISWKINKMHRNREFLSGKVKEMVAKLITDQKFQKVILEYRFILKNFECYDKVQNHFNRECFSLPKNEYALRFMVVLVNMCETRIPSYLIIRAMNDVCTHPPTYGIV
ncbi:legumain [Nephila pilipes]|uniref:Legumain n=1 Tax=Nephila pilipes TaxID=299642 RepID=A0A8X6PV59_NEPPI|nr:legumain [Nephila pilipes]